MDSPGKIGLRQAEALTHPARPGGRVARRLRVVLRRVPGDVGVGDGVRARPVGARCDPARVAIGQQRDDAAVSFETNVKSCACRSRALALRAEMMRQTAPR